jgi:ubiquinone/menaquinone biosynthesis C-methylase UbiE
VNFDRVADIYDATRALPEGVPEQVAGRIVAATHANSDTTFLELGIGTGRIALPLVKRGYPYIGVDISTKMLDQLRSKLAPDTTNLRLLQADVTELPFEDNSVDVALQVHVFHLIPEWKKALTEAWRVLRPDGYFITAYDGSVKDDPGAVIRQKWQELVKEAGIPLREYARRALDTELTARGYRTAVYRVARWEAEFRPITLLEEQRQRTFSASWNVPDGVLESVHQKMVAWATEEYGDIERVIPTRFEFTVAVSRASEESREAANLRVRELSP